MIGASSGIGAALPGRWPAGRARRAVGTRADKLAALGGRGAAAALRCHGYGQPGRARGSLLSAWGGVDLVVYLAGDYTPMRAGDFDLAGAEQVDHGQLQRCACAWRPPCCPTLQPGGAIAFVASVAGYRGLPKALVYGPAKAALINFAECLTSTSHRKDIGVFLINPGFVDTPLTARNDFPMPALLTPEEAAWNGLRLRARRLRDPLPEALHALMKLLAHAALRLVLSR